MAFTCLRHECQDHYCPSDGMIHVQIVHWLGTAILQERIKLLTVQPGSLPVSLPHRGQHYSLLESPDNVAIPPPSSPHLFNCMSLQLLLKQVITQDPNTPCLNCKPPNIIFYVNTHVHAVTGWLLNAKWDHKNMQCFIGESHMIHFSDRGQPASKWRRKNTPFLLRFLNHTLWQNLKIYASNPPQTLPNSATGIYSSSFFLLKSPTGHDTPVPPSPQYPSGFLSRYCWW